MEIELKDSEICYDRDVTLVARVSGADMDYRLVWEANDGSGWFAVASGEEYTFLLTPETGNTAWFSSVLTDPRDQKALYDFDMLPS